MTPFSILSNLTFTIYLALEEPNLMRLPPDTIAAPEGLLSRGVVPQHAEYTGPIMDVWNMLSSMGGFDYVLAESHDFGFSSGVTAVSSSQEPNLLTVGSHWLHPERVQYLHTNSLSTWEVSHGVRLRSKIWDPDLWQRFTAIFTPISPTLWVAIVVFACGTALTIAWIESDEEGRATRAFYEAMLSCTQSASVDSSHNDGRVLGFTHAFFALVFVAVYTANLSSFLSKTPDKDVGGFGDLPADAVVCVPSYFLHPHVEWYGWD